MRETIRVVLSVGKGSGKKITPTDLTDAACRWLAEYPEASLYSVSGCSTYLDLHLDLPVGTKAVVPQLVNLSATQVE